MEELTWGKNLEVFPSKYDVILGADIVYLEETFEDLLRTLDWLSDCKTRILLSCKIRYERDSRFLALLETLFVVDNVYFDQSRGVHIYRVIKRLC